MILFHYKILKINSSNKYFELIRSANMIVFVDIEVNSQTKKVADYGAVREDGAILHSHSKADFEAFVSKCDMICGHNIINHDLKYMSLRSNPIIIDTLFLSPSSANVHIIVW